MEIEPESRADLVSRAGSTPPSRCWCRGERPELGSRDRRSVRVRVWGGGCRPSRRRGARTSSWRPDCSNPSDWSAELVQPVPQPASEGGAGATLLRREFVLRPAGRARARLYATAHGVYEAELNGTVVGDQVLAPGWTSYDHRLRYQTYDVTGLLREGRNAIGIHLADGWYRGYLGFGGKRQVYGDRTAAFVQLEVDHPDGSRTTVTSDGSWRSAPGPLTRADIYNGETFDARREQTGWSTAGFDDAGWTPVEIGSLDVGTLVPPTGPPVRRIQTLPRARDQHLPIRENARRLRAEPGRLAPAAAARCAGRHRDHRPARRGPRARRTRHPAAARGGADRHRHPRRQRSAQLGAAIHLPRLPVRRNHRLAGRTHRRRRGSRCPAYRSAPDRDLHLLGSATSTACTRMCCGACAAISSTSPPTARNGTSGWAGPGTCTVFAPTASYLYDTSGMLRSWLADLAVEQADNDGVVPIFVPHPDIKPPGFPPLQAEAGWGDAAIVVPWVLYERHGDAQILADQWDSMTSWLDGVCAPRRGGAGLPRRGIHVR